MCSATDRRRYALAALGALGIGCAADEPIAVPDAAPPVAASCPVGDVDSPAAIEIVHRAEDGTLATTVPMSPVPLRSAVQGFTALLIGVRATNLDACQVTVTASIRDVCTDQILTVIRQPVALEPTGDGWAEPRDPDVVSNYASVAACPQPNATRDVAGEIYLLEVIAEDASGQRAEASLPIVPYCVDGPFRDSCLCECDSDYVLGEACGPDDPDGAAC